MDHRLRFVSLALCAALLTGLLAGCGGSSSSSSDAPASAGASSEAASSAAASSESLPSSTAEASTSGLTDPDFDENSLFTITGTTDAFQPCLGWGPGVSGCSLKKIIAAASLLQWAESTRLSMRTPEAIQDAYSAWYDTLSDLDRESFAEAWPMIKEAASDLLTKKDSITDLIEDAGLDPDDLPGCSANNWQALETAIDPLVPEAAGEY